MESNKMKIKKNFGHMFKEIWKIHAKIMMGKIHRV
jgi:hypothetical protein